MTSSISIVGGGPAGCSASIYLARNGFDVKLYEKRPNRPKPCGGGLSWRVMRNFKEFLRDIPLLKVKDVVFDLEGEIYEVNFKHNVGCITDRFIFDKHLRSIAQSEGVKIINKKLKKFPNKDIFIDARGYKKSDNPAIAIRGFCKIKNQKMFIGFKRKIVKAGYFWIFPMSDSLANVGVWGAIEGFSVDPLKAYNWFLKKMKFTAFDVSAAPVYYSGKIENLVNRNIIKVGEAAGLVNPFTAEGIYYAMKSGKIAAECIIKNKIDNYEKRIREEFEAEFRTSRFLKSILYFFPFPIWKVIFKFGIRHLKSKI